MAEIRYTKNGEWARNDAGRYTVGLTAAAAADLGDVTFVEAAALGRTLAAGEAACAIEAVKAAADFYSPLGGTIAAGNPALASDAHLLTRDPEGAGWLLVLEGVDEAEFSNLLDPAAWKAWEAGR